MACSLRSLHTHTCAHTHTNIHSHTYIHNLIQPQEDKEGGSGDGAGSSGGVKGSGQQQQQQQQQQRPQMQEVETVNLISSDEEQPASKKLRLTPGVQEQESKEGME